MRGLKLTAFVMISMMLSACSLFLVEDTEDKVCIPKSKLDELGLTMEDLLDESATTDPIDADIVLEPEVDGEPMEPSEPMDPSEPMEPAEPAEPMEPSEPAEPVEPSEPVDDLPVKTYKAGDLVEIAPANAADDIEFTYSEPLDEEGKWQTSEDDAGEYVVEITGTNAAGSLTKKIRIVIESDNNPPSIEDIDDIVVSVGDEVVIAPVISDADGDELTVSYSGWMTEASMTTTSDDIGDHVVSVSVSDGMATVTADVRISVQEVNTAPDIEDPSPITVTEGELVKANIVVTDADGDDITVTFKPPLDENGEWQTESGDAGAYSVTVTADDGEATVEKGFSITVLAANSAPVIETDTSVLVVVNEIEEGVYENAVLTLEPVVTDVDGDDVTVSYSGFMTSDTKEVSDSDEGEHIVTITATDGSAQDSVDVIVTVTVNELPSFDFEI